MSTRKRTKSRPQTRNRSSLAAPVLMALFLGCTTYSGANAALVTSCSDGYYLMLDTTVSPQLKEGLCVTCPRGKFLLKIITSSNLKRVILKPDLTWSGIFMAQFLWIPIN